ncbi:MAG: hypothetical protein R2861_04600 [Desulfobacterales bacterium]
MKALTQLKAVLVFSLSSLCFWLWPDGVNYFSKAALAGYGSTLELTPRPYILSESLDLLHCSWLFGLDGVRDPIRYKVIVIGFIEFLSCAILTVIFLQMSSILHLM